MSEKTAPIRVNAEIHGQFKDVLGGKFVGRTLDRLMLYYVNCDPVERNVIELGEESPFLKRLNHLERDLKMTKRTLKDIKVLPIQPEEVEVLSGTLKDQQGKQRSEALSAEEIAALVADNQELKRRQAFYEESLKRLESERAKLADQLAKQKGAG